VQTAELPDGRWLLDAVGTERFRVTEWLPTTPTRWPWSRRSTTGRGRRPEAQAEAAERRTAVERLLRQVLALQVELGFPAPSAVRSLDEDPGTAAFEAALLSPIGPMDAQKVLERRAPSPAWRSWKRCSTKPGTSSPAASRKTDRRESLCYRPSSAATAAAVGSTATLRSTVEMARSGSFRPWP